MKNKLKICFIAPGFYPDQRGGGINTYVYSISKALIRNGHEVVVLSLSKKINQKWYDFEGIPVYTIKEIPINRYNLLIANLINLWRVRIAVKYLINILKISIVECPEIGAYSLFLYNLPIYKVVRLHTSTKELYRWRNKPILDPRLKLLCYLEFLSVKFADRVSVLNNFSKKIALELYRIDERKIKVLPNLVEPKNKDTIAEDKKNKILYVGRIEKRKGVHIFAKAIPIIAEKIPELIFEFIGPDTREGPNRTSMTEYCKSLIPKNFHKNIIFYGLLSNEEVNRKMREASILVLPSFYEAFGIVLVEAMLKEVAVISTNVGGIPEIIENGETGILINPGDFKGLANAIIKLIENVEFRKKMVEKAKVKAIEKYSTINGIRNFENFYNDIINDK